jgi:hypothetical protein
LFPKFVVPYFMDVGDISEFLDGYRLEYANTLEGILELTGPDVDVLVEPGTEMPLGLDFEPTHPRRHFILGRGRIRPDVIEAARQAEEERAESRRAETRRIAEERAATRKAAAESRRAEAQRLAAERAATRRTASQPASRPR